MAEPHGDKKLRTITIQQSILRKVQPYMSRVATLTQHQDLSPVMLDRVLMSEQVLSGRIAESLQIASAKRRVAMPSSLAGAVELFGYQDVIGFAMLAAADQLFEHLEAEGVPANPMKQQARIISKLTPTLVMRRGRNESKFALAAGIFGHIGVAILAVTLKGEYDALRRTLMGSPCTLYQAEAQRLGFDHGIVGATLLKECGFPIPVIEGVRDHHHVTEQTGVVAVALSVAEDVAHQMGYDQGLANIALDPSADHLKLLGMSDRELHTVVERHLAA